MAAQRNTLQKELILDAVHSLKTHPTAEEIYTHITDSHPSISRATVYRNLKLLSEQNLIRRVSHLDAADRYDFNTTKHYHFRCVNCDKVFDVELPYLYDLIQKVPNPNGFLYQNHAITFTGLCPECRQAQ